MRQTFSRIFVILLTTLFVSAMPLQAAYATADDAQGKEACQVTYETVLSLDVQEHIKQQGGAILKLEGPNAVAFLHKMEQLIGSPAPFTVDVIVIVRPVSDPDAVVNIAYFKDGCMVNNGHLPAALLLQLVQSL